MRNPIHTLIPRLPYLVYHQSQPLNALIFLSDSLSQAHLLTDVLLLSLNQLLFVLSSGLL